MTRKDRRSQEPTHFGRAWGPSWRLIEAEDKLKEAESRLKKAELSSWTRRRLKKTIRDEDARLARLTNRDRVMTRVFARYLRQHNGEMKSYNHFVEWCGAQLLITDDPDELADLDELTDLDVRTIQYWLQNQYGAHGERGKPGHPVKKPAKTER